MWVSNYSYESKNIAPLDRGDGTLRSARSHSDNVMRYSLISSLYSLGQHADSLIRTAYWIGDQKL